MNNSVYQRNILTVFKKTNKNINISAVAGSGKTTILLELLKILPNNSSTLFLAFNNSIVEELKNRNSKEGVDIMTIHSCGWRSILTSYGKVKMNPNKGIAKTEQALKHFKEIPEKKKGWFLYIVPKILDLIRCNLANGTKESIIEVADHYNLNVAEEEINVAMKAFDLMVKDKSQFDFMDMIFVPVTDSRVRFRKYDYVFCDESQDFSACQHAFIKECLSRRGRLITVGDPRQAIYGFAGADARSYEKLSEINGKSIKMPLSVSYRCSVNIVKEAQSIVPEIMWSKDAQLGSVHNGDMYDIDNGDWVLCRNLKPLVQTYLWLLKRRIKSKIRGKDIGEGIIALIGKTGAKTIDRLENVLEKEKENLFVKLKSRGVKKPMLHPKMEILQQRIDVIECLCEEVSTVQELKKLISEIFSDNTKGVMLSTIHKAKGLENEKVFFLCPELIPSKYATMAWEFEQEENLRYVAITRAKKELVYIDSENFTKNVIES